MAWLLFETWSGHTKPFILVISFIVAFGNDKQQIVWYILLLFDKMTGKLGSLILHNSQVKFTGWFWFWLIIWQFLQINELTFESETTPFIN